MHLSIYLCIYVTRIPLHCCKQSLTQSRISLIASHKCRGLSVSFCCAGRTCPAPVQKVAGVALQRKANQAQAKQTQHHRTTIFPLLLCSDDDSSFTMSPTSDTCGFFKDVRHGVISAPGTSAHSYSAFKCSFHCTFIWKVSCVFVLSCGGFLSLLFGRDIERGPEGHVTAWT